MKILFELSVSDAACIVAWIPEIIEKGVSPKDAPAFRRLAKALQKPLPRVERSTPNSSKKHEKDH